MLAKRAPAAQALRPWRPRRVWPKRNTSTATWSFPRRHQLPSFPRRHQLPSFPRRREPSVSRRQAKTLDPRLRGDDELEMSSFPRRHQLPSFPRRHQLPSFPRRREPSVSRRQAKTLDPRLRGDEEFGGVGVLPCRSAVRSTLAGCANPTLAVRGHRGRRISAENGPVDRVRPVRRRIARSWTAAE
jgi:hypothetical protein